MKSIIIKTILISLVFCLFNRCALFLNEDGFNPLNRHTEDGLPVFYIHPAPISTKFCPVTLYYRGIQYQAEARIRGSVSTKFPMKSYTIKFSENQLFNDPMFQFYNKRKIVLITSFSDNSFIRHRLAYDLWNRMHSEHIRIKSYNAVVYLNGRYWGLYTVSEHVDGFLMEEHGLNRYGNLYKGVTHEANFFPKENLHEGFLKKEGYPEHGDQGAYTILDNLVEFICTTEPDDFIARIDTVLKQEEYEDWWLFVTFIIASDSCNKNAYHFFDPEIGLWRYIPWDLNFSFGQNGTWRINPLDEVDYSKHNNLFKRFIKQEEIYNPLKARYFSILSSGNAFDIDWILLKINEYYQEIRTAAIKSEKKWREEYREYGAWEDREDFTTFEEEIQYIINWISERHSFLLEQYN